MKKGFIVLFIGLFFSFCTEEKPPTTTPAENNTRIEQIKYGNSFGMCVGHCISELAITSSAIYYSSYGWTDEVPTQSCNEDISITDWYIYSKNIDTTAFFALEERIGCPDCADGGSEWLELKLANGKTHKVTFEYYNEPSLLKEYIKPFREWKEHFKNCK